MVCALPPLQVRVQVEPPLQLIEQELVQATSQVELLQLTLPLAPTENSQLEPPVQLRLLLLPVCSLQVAPALQPPLHESLQLSSEQDLAAQLTSQLFELQLTLVQPVEPPHARRTSAKRGSSDLVGFTASPRLGMAPVVGAPDAKGAQHDRRGSATPGTPSWARGRGKLELPSDWIGSGRSTGSNSAR